MAKNFSLLYYSPEDQINLTFNLTLLQICRNCKQHYCCKYILLIQSPSYGENSFQVANIWRTCCLAKNLCKRCKDSWTNEATVMLRKYCEGKSKKLVSWYL